MTVRPSAVLATMAGLTAIRAGLYHAHGAALVGSIAGAVLVAAIANQWLAALRRPSGAPATPTSPGSMPAHP